MATYLIPKKIEVCDPGRAREIVSRRLRGALPSPNPLAAILNPAAPEREAPELAQLPKVGDPAFADLIRPDQIMAGIERTSCPSTIDREFKETVLDLKRLYLQMRQDAQELEAEPSLDDRAKIDRLNEKYGVRLQELWVKIYGIMRKNLGFSYENICKQLSQLIAGSEEARAAFLTPQELFQSSPLRESRKLAEAGISKNKIKEALLRQAPPEVQAFLEHRAYVQRELQGFYLSSPFLRRIYEKPLGYAGDFEMLSYLYDNKITGQSLFEKVIHFFAMNWETAGAVRSRIPYSSGKIREGYGENRGADFTFVNIACGNAQETVRIINEGGMRQANVLLFDYEALAWESIANALGLDPEIPQGAKEVKGSKGGAQVTFVKRAVFDLFMGKYKLPLCDLIYINGLFDYLSDEYGSMLIMILFAQLKPGGKLIIGNLKAKDKAAIGLMEAAIEWYLFYRDETQLRSLARNLGDQAEVATEEDLSGIQLYLTIKKRS